MITVNTLGEEVSALRRHPDSRRGMTNNTLHVISLPEHINCATYSAALIEHFIILLH